MLERDVCRNTVASFNEERGNPSGVHFMVRGWEQLPAGIGRPQARINPAIDDCDYMILMLGERWGSAPSHYGNYSSGTEEEFHYALDLLASPTAEMRDLLVLFKTIEANRLRDPGSQLQAVMDFRDRLETSRSLQYATFDSNESLEGAVLRNLSEWSKPLVDRVPTRISLSTRVAGTVPLPEPTDRMLETAKERATSGYLMQAEAAFSHAIKDGNPEALTEFAQFMRRTGRLDQALKLNRQLLDDPILLARDDADAVAYRTNSLANMGVIHRKRGELNKSRALLHEAVETARSSNKPVDRHLCYALDNYGFTLMRLNDVDLARSAFEEALDRRQQFGSPIDLSQSAINLGRSQMNLGDYAAAEGKFVEAIRLIGGSSHDELLANALSALVESRLRQDKTEEVRSNAEQALEINMKVQNSDGASIGHALLARVLLSEGDHSEAEKHARASQELSRESNSAAGLGTSFWLLAEIAFARGEVSRAIEFLQEAERYDKVSQNSLLTSDIAESSERYAAATRRCPDDVSAPVTPTESM
ncbi:tetratricopeptide repeat protein [Dietzia sp. CQ4]|nr:tetratricopeptide repeat protein [Dietzia sp. CQ4]